MFEHYLDTPIEDKIKLLKAINPDKDTFHRLFFQAIALRMRPI